MKSIASKKPTHAEFSAQLAAMDWRAAWWQPWQTAARGVAEQVAQGAALHDALNAYAQHTAQPASFVAQSALPVGMAYEHYIFDSCLRPVSLGLHDFFNGICWLNFPQTKARLNALQAAEISAHGVQATRGPLRDALTLFDESAAIALTHCGTRWPPSNGSAHLCSCEPNGTIRSARRLCCLATPCWRSWFHPINRSQPSYFGRKQLLIR
jgi:Protein of unknown function (DUF3025)